MVTPSRRKMMPMSLSSPAVETKLVFSTRTYTPMNNARQPSIPGSSTSNAQREKYSSIAGGFIKKQVLREGVSAKQNQLFLGSLSADGLQDKPDPISFSVLS